MFQWMFLIVFVCCYLGIWVWYDYIFRCWFLDMPLLDDVLFLDFCFFSELENGMAVCCLFSWQVLMVCSEGRPAIVRGYDTGMC